MRKRFLYLPIHFLFWVLFISLCRSKFTSVIISFSFCLKKKTSFNMSYSRDLPVLNSLASFFFFFGWKVFTSPFLKDVALLPSCLHIFWWKVLLFLFLCFSEWMCHFSVLDFKILSLSLVFRKLNYMAFWRWGAFFMCIFLGVKLLGPVSF